MIPVLRALLRAGAHGVLALWYAVAGTWRLLKRPRIGPPYSRPHDDPLEEYWREQERRRNHEER